VRPQIAHQVIHDVGDGLATRIGPTSGLVRGIIGLDLCLDFDERGGFVGSFAASTNSA
jgi:hypothetical protein